MSKGIFITGTDTGVGKSIVAATLARLLRMRGVKVGVMKPVTSGCYEVNGELVSDDALLLCKAAGLHCSSDVTPYLLREPIVPSEAARVDQTRIAFPRITECFHQLSQTSDFMIVEGAGGLMVPLSGGLLIADLVLSLELPLLVVARPDLGTINHTLLTCFAAKQLGLDLSGIIINNFPENPDLAEKTAPHQIGALCGTNLLGIWPHKNCEEPLEVVNELADWLNSQKETEIVLRELGL